MIRIGHHVLRPQLLPRLLNHRQFMMAVEFALTQTREMLATSHHPGVAPARAKTPAHKHYLLGILRHRTRTHHRARRFKCQIKRRSKINIESKRPAILPNHAPMLPKQPPVARRKNIRRRRRPANRFAKPIHPPALKIHTGKQRSLDQRLAVAQQLPSLLSTDNISRKQNHARRLDAPQQGTERRTHLRPIKPDDQKLSDVRCKVCHEK